MDLAFKVGGYIHEIFQVQGIDGQMRNVQGGDWVAKGIVLARVRQSDYLEKVNQAKAYLVTAQAASAQTKAQLVKARAASEKARLDFERATNLFALQSLTKPDYDTAKANLDTSQAAVDEAQAQIEAAQSRISGARAQLKEAELALGDSALKTPMDGILLRRQIDVGSLVGSGTVGFTLVDVSSVKVVFGVPDMMLGRLQLGSPLAITLESIPGTEFSGRITAISPTADPRSRVFDIEVTVPNPQSQLKLGMVASLQVAGGKASETTPVVPLSAIVRPKDNPAGYAIFLVEAHNGKEVARLRHVKVGVVYGDLIAVPEGVQIGERVITTGTTLLVDGEPIRAIP